MRFRAKFWIKVMKTQPKYEHVFNLSQLIAKGHNDYKIIYEITHEVLTGLLGKETSASFISHQIMRLLKQTITQALSQSTY